MWHFLEDLPGLMALPTVWRRHLAHDFEPFSLLCLQPGPKPALSFPCPLPTSCAYRIVSVVPPLPSDGRGIKGEGSFSPSSSSSFSSSIPGDQHESSNPLSHKSSAFAGFCRQTPPRCEPISLTLPDITPSELNWTKLSRSISKAFALDSKF